jgi:UDPglucose 6-dehydrogenase
VRRLSSPSLPKEARTNDNVEYVSSKYDALVDADAMLLVTEWKEFRAPDFEEMGQRLNNKIIFDGRNQYNRKRLEESGWEYFEIGV